MKAKLYILLCFLFSQLEAQELKSLAKFELPFEPVTSSIDRQGFLYFASREGVIEKYNQQGELEYHYSPPKKATPSLIEAWQGLKVFVYYEAFQEYLFLNRFLTDSDRYNLSDLTQSSFNGMVTTAADNNLWVFNNNDLSLSKIDVTNGEILFENALNLTLDKPTINPSFMREYQNLLFISDKDLGILVFDNLGNYLENIAEKDVQFFSFNERNLVFTKGNNIVLLDIYNKKRREISTANLSYDLVFMENKKFFALSGKTVEILSLN